MKEISDDSWLWCQHWAADGLAPLGARPSAVTVMTKFGTHMQHQDLRVKIHKVLWVLGLMRQKINSVHASCCLNWGSLSSLYTHWSLIIHVSALGGQWIGYLCVVWCWLSGGRSDPWSEGGYWITQTTWSIHCTLPWENIVFISYPSKCYMVLEDLIGPVKLCGLKSKNVVSSIAQESMKETCLTCSQRFCLLMIRARSHFW